MSATIYDTEGRAYTVRRITKLQRVVVSNDVLRAASFDVIETLRKQRILDTAARVWRDTK